MAKLGAKLGILLSSAVLGMFVMSGCSSNVINDSTSESINLALDGAPDWVLGTSDVLSATGTAKIKSNNIGYAVTEAEAQARATIAGQISTQVEQKYRQLTTSSGDNVTAEGVTALRESVNQTLTGTKTTKKWISKTNDMWVLVQADESALERIKKYISTSQNIDKAAAKALAQAVDELIDGVQ